MIVIVVVAVAWASASGRLAELRYTNIPIFHPYPPSGFVVNPFTGDVRDLISKTEADRVQKDFLADGRIEQDAFARGDAAPLATAEAGRALAQSRQLLASYTAQGIVERSENQLDSVHVGRLGDPNDPSIRWAAQEVGRSTLTRISQSTGAVVQRQRTRFDAKFWLVMSAGRYLIVDIDISSQSLGSG